jgi:hypothetical protein
MMRCRTVGLVAVRPLTFAGAVDIFTAPVDPEERRCFRHEQFMANKERRWCSLPYGHDGEHALTQVEAPPLVAAAVAEVGP